MFQQVGNNIQKVLQEKGKTPQYLADVLNISVENVDKIILGTKAVNVSEIFKIASILDVSVEKLLDVAENECGNTNRIMIEPIKSIIDEIILLDNM